MSSAVTVPSSASTNTGQARVRHRPVSCDPHLTCDVDTVNDADWDEIAAGFDDVSLEQMAAYTNERWGDRRTSHLLVRRNGEVIAASRIIQHMLPGATTGVAYVKFGPMWRRRGEDADRETYRAILDALAAEYCDRRGLLLSILPRPNPAFATVEHTLLEELGFARRREFQDPNRYLVDVSLAEDEQRASLGQSWRRNLKKAQSAGLEISMGIDDKKIDQFAHLHARMVDRKNAAHGDALHVLPKLLREAPAALQPKFVIASADEEPVAGAVIALHGDTAYYVYGATNSKALPLRAGYALQWWIVRNLAEGSARWYDLGGSVGDSGLCQFKSGLVGKRGRVVQIPGEFDRWASLGDRVAGDMVFAMRGIAKTVSSSLSAGMAK